jgi:hypothetical protein
MKYTRNELADLIEKFASESSSLGEWEWDDFECDNFSSTYEDLLQKLVFLVARTFPPSHQTEWCSRAGELVLLNLANAIRNKSIPFPPLNKELELMGSGCIPPRYKRFFDVAGRN